MRLLSIADLDLRGFPYLFLTTKDKEEGPFPLREEEGIALFRIPKPPPRCGPNEAASVVGSPHSEQQQGGGRGEG